jgi:hypothetical protein
MLAVSKGVEILNAVSRGVNRVCIKNIPDITARFAERRMWRRYFLQIPSVRKTLTILEKTGVFADAARDWHKLPPLE